MKNSALIFTTALVFALILFLQPNASAQAIQDGEWMRVESDDGEFSIEVPARHKFVGDKSGFTVSNGESDFPLREMKMLNAYAENSLLSFERYTANRAALDVIRNQDKDDGNSTEIRRGDDVRIKQILTKNDKFYAVRQYFYSKSHIYILTAAARSGETAAIKRFLDSLIFKPLSGDDKTGNNKTPGAISFSRLKASEIVIDENPKPYEKPDKDAKPKTKDKTPDENASRLLIVNKQSPSYTVAALLDGTTGKIGMRLTFSEDGFVSKVGFLTSLKQGLLRQAFFSAARIKFLPAEKDGKPKTVTSVVEYHFGRY